ncbi:MAG: patatin-like phospholipase family protein [Bacteroidetes bacterium]|nr:patatin-like phospholipase family protein [Bacteroidota bacterium]
MKILTIDGGGIRGLIPAKFLQLVEDELGTAIHTYFDLVCGTSTGGIIALAIGAGIPMAEVVKMYCDAGPKIFRPGGRFRISQFPLLFSKHSSAPLSQALRGVFKQRILGDSLVRLCIPSINITDGQTTVFKTRHTRDHVYDEASPYKRDYLRSMYDVAMSTSAAPTYFPTHRIPGVGRHVDGGLWANNPSLIGISEAIRMGYGIEEIEVLSVGTGNTKFNERRIGNLFSGIAGWRTRLIDLTFLAQSQGYDFTAQYLLGPTQYFRVDPVLPTDFKLDQTKHIGRYLEYAEAAYRKTATDTQRRFFITPNR